MTHLFEQYPQFIVIQACLVHTSCSKFWIILCINIFFWQRKPELDKVVVFSEKNVTNNYILQLLYSQNESLKDELQNMSLNQKLTILIFFTDL